MTEESFDWYRDRDEDKYGDPNDTIISETQPKGYVSDNTDCNDNDASINPGVTEECNGIDDDCDGDMDDGLTFDADNDGYTSIGSCQGSKDDCNDGNESIHPGATEICNDNVDQDCNRAIDCADSECSDDPACQICTDADSDTYYAESGCGTAVDCNDSDESIYPGAPELCDGKDNQCPGNSGYSDVDEDCDFSIWIGDNDGYGYDVPDNSDLPRAEAENQFCARKDPASSYNCSQYINVDSCESSGECRWVDWIFNNQESSEMSATDGSQYTDAEKYILGWPNANFTITFGPVETGHFYNAKFVMDVSGIQTSRFGSSSLYLDDVDYSEYLPDEQGIFGSDVITIPITDPSLFTDGSLKVHFQTASPDASAIDYFYFQLWTQ